MIEPLEAIIQKYKTQKSQESKETFQYLNILHQFFESRSDNFLESIHRYKQENGLLISNINFTNYYILATDKQENPFESRIKADFQTNLDPDFLLGFIQVVKKRIALLRKKEENKQYRGRILTFCKDSEQKNPKSKHYPSFDKPLLLRLDYSIVHQQIDPSLLNQKISETFLFAYTLSSIKKQIFTKEQVTYYINDSYRLLQQSKGLTPQSLTNKVIKSKWFNTYKNIFIYKDLDKNNLIYDFETSKSIQESKKSIPCLNKIKLALIYTQWKNGYACFGTGFLFDHRAVLTSAKNVVKGGDFVISKVQICLKPDQQKRQWIIIGEKDIKRFQSQDAALLIFPQNIKLEKKVAIRIQDHSKCLPSYVYCSYVYGFEFKADGKNIVFFTSLTPSIFQDKPTFDSFYDIKSRSSSGSLVFFITNNEATIFGIYNPFNKSVFNFSLLHNPFAQQIYATFTRKQILLQTQALIGDDDRQAVPFNKLNEKPYSAIGMIYSKIQLYDKRGIYRGEKGDNGDGVQGTGTFISPNLILTCAHNVLGKYQSGGTYIATQVYFYPSLSKQNGQNKLSQIINGKNYPYYTIPVQGIYVPKSYLENYLTNKEDRFTSDIAILYLKNESHPSYLSIRSVPQNDIDFWKNTNLKVCGYPGESEGTLKEAEGKAFFDINLIQKENEDFKRTPNTLYYEIDATQGNSGTAVIFQRQKNEFQVVAVHTLGHFQKIAVEKMGLVNSGPLLVNQNLKFVQEKLKILLGPKKTLKNQFNQFYNKNYA